jgi:hypothetical protein
MTKAEALHIYNQLKLKIGSKAKNDLYVLKIIIARNIEHAKDISNQSKSALPYMPEKYFNDTEDVDLFVFFTDGRSGFSQHYLKYVQENDIEISCLR